MDFYRLIKTSSATAAYALIAFICFTGCSALQPAQSPRAAADTVITPVAEKHDSFVRDNVESMKVKPAVSSPEAPEYQPVSDDMSPANSRLINIQSRNSTLGDILHVIADAASLNLIIGDGVEQTRPITISLKRVSAEEALSTVLNSADYFFTIKNNVLSVDATNTKIFELGHPAMIQGYNVDVGGDILGSGSALSAGSGGGSSNIKGTISQTVKNDTKAFDFWDGLEKSLQTMIGGQLETVTEKVDSLKQYRTEMNSSVDSNKNSNINRASDKKGAETATVTSEKMLFPSTTTNKPQQLIVINRLTGTIMVTATRNNLTRIEDYLNMLRITLNRQVLVEARVIEVQLNDSLKYGIDWNFFRNVSWFNASTGSAAMVGGFGAVTVSGSSDNAAPAFRLGFSNNDVSSLLSALKTQGEVKTLSNPRINVMNGQTALLTVGRNQNYIASVETTTDTSTPPKTTFTVKTGNVLSGIMIGLAPIINSKGEISLTVTPIVSDLVGLEDKRIGSDPANQTSISIPTVDLRELSTTVKVHSGEMIVLGGLIANKQHLQDEKVPILGDIPWIKTLFTRKNNVDSRSELVVILQPHIIKDK